MKRNQQINKLEIDPRTELLKDFFINTGKMKRFHQNEH